MKDDCKKFVKKEMQKKFVTYRHNNFPDFFSAGVVLTVHSVMMDLEEGKSPKEAWKMLPNKHHIIQKQARDL